MAVAMAARNGRDVTLRARRVPSTSRGNRRRIRTLSLQIWERVGGAIFALRICENRDARVRVRSEILLLPRTAEVPLLLLFACY